MRRVVVTGLGAITPVGNNIEETWNNMCDGVCGIDTISRFDTSDLPVHVAGQVKDFDPVKYIEKREVRKTDLYCQYALGAAAQAVEDSGVLGTVDETRFGVYVGAGIGGLITFVENTENFLKGGSRKVSPHFIPKMIGNIAAGRIAIEYKAKGPSLAPVSACATGANAVGEAFHAIKDGYADVIIAGGAEAVIHPLTIAGFANCKALSTTEDPKRASIPFDVDRNGFVMGEGAGMLVLEELEHAKARGAKIYAEFIGYGNTCDAYHVTAPDPEADGLANAIKLAFEEGNVSENDSIYINAHGTSTHMNDVTETMAIKKALGEQAKKAAISSTKSMTGHMLGATGAVEAIVAVLAVKEGKIPPTIGTTNVDPECDLDYTIGSKAVEKKIDVAASTNLGFGGHDACVLFKAYKE
ncbi:MAG: beta-ketoacyl-ACP synthase II [Ruminococcus sp.]